MGTELRSHTVSDRVERFGAKTPTCHAKSINNNCIINVKKEFLVILMRLIFDLIDIKFYPIKFLYKI